MAQIRPEQIKLEENTLLVGVSQDGVFVAKAKQLDPAGQVDLDNTQTHLKLYVKDGSIGTDQLADGSITSAKLDAQFAIDTNLITNGSITPSKLDPNSTFTFNTTDEDFFGYNRPILQIIGTPSHSHDVVNKAYVDNLVTGLDFKESVLVATEANIADLSQTSGTIDGVQIEAGDRILVKAQTNASQNGIYSVNFVNGNGTFELIRSDDANSDTELSAGAFVFVEAGTLFGGQGYVLQANNGSNPLLSNGDPLTFVQFNGANSIVEGSGINKSNNTISVALSQTGGLEFDGNDDITLKLAMGSSLSSDGNGLALNYSLGLSVNNNQLELHVDAESIKFLGDGSIQASILHSDTLTEANGGFVVATGLTNLAVAKTPVAGSKIMLFVNGIAQKLGNGVTTGCDAYICNPSFPGTAKSWGNIVADDRIYWVSSAAGFTLDNTDYIDLVYQTNSY